MKDINKRRNKISFDAFYIKFSLKKFRRLCVLPEFFYCIMARNKSAILRISVKNTFESIY